jgi:D-alanyl-D-alanine carboxypeptidase
VSKRLIAIGAALCLGWTAVMAVLLWPGGDDEDTSSGVSLASTTMSEDASTDAAEIARDFPSQAEEALDELPVPGEFAVGPAEAPPPVEIRLKKPPASGVLFDVDTGEVLWARRPGKELPVASLTKMMTALIVAEGHGPGERVLVGAKAPHVEGSRIGVLKPGRRFPLRGLFLGLILVSGNDAAVALAEHDAGTVAAFVEKMNRRAAELGLGCTRFAGPAGLQDAGNSSCAYDLAALARADLANDWIASVAARRSASLPFPVKGGRLELANNHYFVQEGITGVPAARVTGLKTGYTNGAGRCYVTTARLGGRHLGVVLLDSPDPIRQVPRLLAAGFSRG